MLEHVSYVSVSGQITFYSECRHRDIGFSSQQGLQVAIIFLINELFGWTVKCQHNKHLFDIQSKLQIISLKQMCLKTTIMPDIFKNLFGSKMLLYPLIESLCFQTELHRYISLTDIIG